MKMEMGAQRKIMILGANSLVGRHLSHRFGSNRTVATFNKKPLRGGVFFDALTMAPAVLAEAARACSHGVILLANSNPDDCARDPGSARRLNVDATKAIIDQLDEWGILPVFTSSEAVFDGGKGLYSEVDPISPLMTYAKQKVEIERYLVARDRPYIIARLARVVTSDPGDDTLFSAWLRQIKAHRTIRCATDHIFSPVHAEDAADALIALIDRGRSGLFHVGGPDALDRATMLDRLIQAWRDLGQAFNGEVLRCVMSDFVTLEPRPRDISLRSSALLFATGIRPRDVATICQDLVHKELSSCGQLP